MKMRGSLISLAGLLLTLLGDRSAAAAPAPLARRPKEIASFPAHRTAVTSLGFSPDGKILASGGMDEKVKLWDTASWKNLAAIRAHFDPNPKGGRIGIVYRLAFSPDGKTVASYGYDGHDRIVKLWDAATGRLVGTFDTASHHWPPLAFSPDGKTLVCGNELFDLETKTARRVVQQLQGDGPIAVFGPEAELRLATYFRNPRSPSFSLWDVKTGKKTIACRGTPDSQYFRYIDFSRDGTRVVSLDGEHLIRLWDSATGENTANFEPADKPYHPILSPNGKVLVYACTPRATEINCFRLLEVPGGKLLATLKCDIRLSTSLPAFSPDGQLLAAGGSGGVIKIWSLPKRYAADTGNEKEKK